MDRRRHYAMFGLRGRFGTLDYALLGRRIKRYVLKSLLDWAMCETNRRVYIGFQKRGRAEAGRLKSN